MSIIIAYFEGDVRQRIHINDYEKDKHKGKVTCADGHAVMGKKGAKVVWHYSHTKGVECSATREMGSWHHWWQDRVEPEFLEIRMKRDGKLHIADMQNGDDLVIEFQKSVVGPEIILEREKFYDRMIWVFCCSDMVMKVVSSCGRFMKLKMVQGSRFFLTATKQSFLDFDKRGVLELLDKDERKKSKTFLYVRIWTTDEFDKKFMRNCLKDDAPRRADRPPYVFEDKDIEFQEARKTLDSKK